MLVAVSQRKNIYMPLVIVCTDFRFPRYDLDLTAFCLECDICDGARCVDFQRLRNPVSETDPGFAVGKLTNWANVRPTCSADSYLRLKHLP